MMQRSFGRLCFAVCALGTLTDFRLAPPTALPPIRQLTFDVTYDSTSEIIATASSFGKSGTETAIGPSTHREPVITIDVIAAPTDGTLAADVSEVDGRKSDAPVRVGVTDHALTYAPSADLTEEERVLLHFLARDIIAPEHVGTGDDWHDAVHLNGTKFDVDYHVSRIDLAAKTFTASIRGTSSEDRVNGVQVTLSGSLTYDIEMLVPIVLDFHTVSSTENRLRVARIDAHYRATLRSDSFKNLVRSDIEDKLSPAPRPSDLHEQTPP